jgi:hypothetical protein
MRWEPKTIADGSVRWQVRFAILPTRVGSYRVWLEPYWTLYRWNEYMRMWVECQNYLKENGPNA